MTPEAAQKIATNAFIWLAGEPDYLGHFLSLSGLSVDEVKANANDADFLGAVLDFVTSDDRMVMAFCDLNNLAYETPLEARQSLPGGALPNWT